MRGSIAAAGAGYRSIDHAHPLPHRYRPSHRGPPEDHEYIVRFPDLEEALTSGRTEAEALANAVDALETVLEWRMEEGRSVPRPSPARGRPMVAPGTVTADKALLHLALRESGRSPRMRG